MRTFFSRAVTDFLLEDVICCHGCFTKLIIDGRLENKDAITKLTRRYEEKRVLVLAYYTQANGMIECGQKSIIETL